MGFSRQEYWSGLPFPSPDLPSPGIEPGSPTLQADPLPSEPPGKPQRKDTTTHIHSCCCCCVASVVSDSGRAHRRQPTRLPRPWDSPGKNTEWVAISFSNAWKWKLKVKSPSGVQILATPATVPHFSWFSLLQNSVYPDIFQVHSNQNFTLITL